MTQMTLSPFEQTITANGSNDLDSANPTGAGGAPLAPSGFTATYLSDTSLSLAWTDNSSTELNFEIDRSPNGTDTWTSLSDPVANATSATDTGLTVDTTYYYRLRAVNAAGNSDYVTASGLTTAGVTSTPNLYSTQFDEDNFALTDLNTAIVATVDVGNFTWGGGSAESLVTGGAGANSQVWNSNITVNDSRDWSAHDGLNALRFRYPAGVNQSELRFSYDALSELWVRYWIRVPTNFTHNSSSPSNSKLFVLWMEGTNDTGDSYSNKGEGSTVAWEFWNDGGSGSTVTFHSSDETFSVMGGHQQDSPFITYPTDQGRWMQLVFHVKAATSTTANDGIIEMHRRWDGESAFTQIHYTNTADIGIPAAVSGFRHGYLMGYSNPTYAADTEWLVDKFQVSTGSLL